MICVSIGRGRHRFVIATHKHLAEQGAELVELRLDYINGPVNLKRLLADRPCPVVVTCRRKRDGGKYKGSEEERLILLRSAIAAGVEYVDLEDDVAMAVPRFGSTRRIISLHDFRKTPADLEAIHGRLAQLDPDVVKICTMANVPSDNLRMLRLVQKSKVPTVGLCMGDMGVPSRVLTGRFGAPFTYATFSEERTLAPGQLSFAQMKDVYHYDEINRETDVYGVIADPIGHSLSPLIHNAAFHHLKLNKVYVPIRVPRESLSAFIDESTEMGIRGLSVTIPHKEAVVGKLTEADGAVEGIGAANTVVYDEHGRRGYNTDHQAAMDSLASAVGSLDDEPGPLQGKVALVLGAGGVGKAIAFGLIRHGAKVMLTDGDPERAVELAEKLDCRAVEWSARHSASADVLVNCTPVGMHPEVNETPFEKHHLRPGMIVFDVVYNPENTLLVKEARREALHVGILMAAFSLLFIIVQVPVGALSDRLGRKGLLAAGL
ncbi:MAG: type I 3-dehydroquinate dehydratase, partial [Planctomycetes bacterium]|nr:type I 3-dehydroquinate dehydratase [Planctomycetota bacterium]